MSWSASGTAENGEVEISVNGELSPESFEQFEIAGKAAEQVIASGALGNPAGKYYVTVSGHANANHKPTSGWSNDSLTISISQATPQPKEEDNG